MPITIRRTALDGLFLVEPGVHADARGYFLETWHEERYAAFGVAASFVQDNVSRSAQGILRGLHLQEPFGQGKLVHVLDGEVFDVAVDVRVGSPTFGQWIGERLSADNHVQIYIPPGFAHGFCVLSQSALLAYKCTEVYRPEYEISVAWNDPAVQIAWPVSRPTLSEKDARAPRLADIPETRLPRWVPPRAS